MLYTVGHKKSYLQYLKEDGPAYKLGRGYLKDGTYYDGGIVFKTIQEAKEYLISIEKQREWDVFGLLADWGKDTAWSTLGSYRSLLVNAEIISLGDYDCDIHNQ